LEVLAKRIAENRTGIRPAWNIDESPNVPGRSKVSGMDVPIGALDPSKRPTFFGACVLHGRTPIGSGETVHSVKLSFRPWIVLDHELPRYPQGKS
jgi:hypothetical protein